MGLFQNIRQRRVDAGKPLLFPNRGTVPDPTPGSPGAMQPSAGTIAADLKEQERQRQERITQGRAAIDTAFGRFNDDYFRNYAGEVTGYYYPQIDDQFGRAMGTTRAALRNRGVGQSTIAGGAFSDLLRDRNRARTEAANNAAGAAGQLRGNVERTRTDLYNLNESAADPAAANARATAEATALVAPPSVSPIGQIFAATLGPVVAGVNAYRNRAPNPAYPGAPTGAYGSGSGRVVG